MAPFTEREKDVILSNVFEALSKTPYACSSLTQLTNGTTNLVFRGELIQPILEQGRGRTATTVIIKHSLEHAALNKDFPIDISRALYEEAMLEDLAGIPTSSAEVKTPRIHLFIRALNIQVLEDFPGTVDLKSIFVSPTADDVLTTIVATSIGYNIGAWLRSFHDRSMSRNGKLKNLGNNQSMRRLKHTITYDAYIKVLENGFPSLLEGHRPLLEQIRNAAAGELERVPKVEDEDRNWVLIHGDFWSGNVLVPTDLSSPDTLRSVGAELFIVDWEFTQLGHRAYDIGQMIGDIYERGHFAEAKGAIPAIEGFIKGYGVLRDQELPFRIAIHAGVHLIGWYIRRDPNSPLPCSLEKATDAMRIGRDWILKGWQEDTEFFKSSPLASLFER
ncbi:hypothetical protein NUW58_g2467 [Xylaria curta]|uniref:Uncharacterized protein n=1 Tax=Xylaria curta TaxID=42375 RepID=A0ACC1PFY8_9PEZI|nr:hypothetical protein NUW58_g2467 [Xylaria curta]